MRKCVAILAVLLMAGGCSGLNQFLCHPTDSQTEAANVGMAVAQSILSGLSYFTGNPVVSLVSVNAIPVFQRVVQGYCVAQDSWDAAVTALAAAQAQAKAQGGAKAFPKVQGQIQYLQSVRW